MLVVSTEASPLKNIVHYFEFPFIDTHIDIRIKHQLIPIALMWCLLITSFYYNFDAESEYKLFNGEVVTAFSLNYTRENFRYRCSARRLTEHHVEPV